jgi:hypothetical protein
MRKKGAGHQNARIVDKGVIEEPWFRFRLWHYLGDHDMSSEEKNMFAQLLPLMNDCNQKLTQYDAMKDADQIRADGTRTNKPGGDPGFCSSPLGGFPSQRPSLPLCIANTLARLWTEVALPFGFRCFGCLGGLGCLRAAE